MHIIILAYTIDDRTKNFTLDALKSLELSNYTNIIQSVLIIENTSFKWDFITKAFEVNCINLIKEFNYNQFLNLGIKYLNGLYLLEDNDYIACCNNDLIFDKDWTKIVLHNYASMSPKCSITKTQQEFTKNTYGYRTAKELSGWAIILKFKTWNTIKGFDEDISFWCSDDSYRFQLNNHHIEHYLIPSSIVTHLDNGSNTLKTMIKQERDKLTIEQAKIFNKKYNQNLFGLK